MKNTVYILLIALVSCTNTNLKSIRQLQVTNSNEVVPLLFEIWDQQSFSLIEKKLGPPSRVEEINSEEKSVSYTNPNNMTFPLLTLKINKEGKILSMYYLLTETTSTVNREWFLNKYKNLNWKEKKLAIGKSHEVVQKIILWNEEKQISAGYIDRFRGNQIEYIYFDKSGDDYRNKVLFFYE